MNSDISCTTISKQNTFNTYFINLHFGAQSNSGACIFYILICHIYHANSEKISMFLDILQGYFSKQIGD